MIRKGVVWDGDLTLSLKKATYKGGTNRISNLTLSCEKCNLKKGTQDIKEFLKKDPKRLKEIEAQAKKPLYVGRLATRATGSFNISTKSGLIEGISYKDCKTIYRKDGYGCAV